MRRLKYNGFKVSTQFILTAVLLITSNAYAQAIMTNSSTINGTVAIKTWKELRDQHIEKQDLDYSCGSASVATILRSFYGKQVFEIDVLTEIEKFGNDGAASFLDLEKAAEVFGFKGIGLSVSFEKLKSIKIPAIVYLHHRGVEHFSVIRGVARDGTVWLGDPSWGNRKFSRYQFNDMWETRDDEKLKGKILLIIPQDKSTANLNKDFFYPPEINNTAIELLTIRR